MNLKHIALGQAQKSLLLHETSHPPNPCHLSGLSWTGESLRPSPSLQAQCPGFSLGQLGFHLHYSPILCLTVSKAIFLKCKSLHGLPLPVRLPGKLDSHPPRHSTKPSALWPAGPPHSCHVNSRQSQTRPASHTSTPLPTELPPL